MEVWRKVTVGGLMLNLTALWLLFRSVMLTLTVVCQRCGINLTVVDLRYEQFEGLPFYWWELTSEVWSARGIVLTWQTWGFATPCRVDKQSLYSIENFHYQRYSINLVMIVFCGPTILWMRIGKWFWRKEWSQVHLGFLANPQLSTDLRCLYQLPFELG